MKYLFLNYIDMFVLLWVILQIFSCQSQDLFSDNILSKDIFQNVELSDYSERIMAANIVEIHDYPFMVSIQKSGSHICGGALITFDLVLSAAHCFNDFKNNEHVAINYTAIAGIMDITDPDDDSMRVVKSYYMHEFHWDLFVNDIIVLKLVEPFKESLTIRLVATAMDERVDLTKLKCWTVGWGIMQERNSTEQFDRRKRQSDADKLYDEILGEKFVENPPLLRRTDLPVINNDKCTKTYGTKYITDRHICTLHADGTKETCLGDSGGPLLCESTLYGITSWGQGCTRPDFPGVWTRVSKFAKFIAHVFNGTQYTIPTYRSTSSSMSFSYYITTIFPFIVLTYESC